jgi:uncharacterized protein YlaI
MTSTEQVILFYDILENSNPIFRVTEERPITDVVFQYLNEAQISLFNNRYLPGNMLENINAINSFKNELKSLLTTTTPILSTGNRYDYSKTTPWSTEMTFVDGTINITRSGYPIASTVKVDLVPILDIYVNRYLTNHTNKPIILQPVVFVDRSENALCIIHDSVTTITTDTTATITVLNKPAMLSINQNCQLDSRFHEQVVRNAVTLFLQDKLNLTKKDGSTRDAV